MRIMSHITYITKIPTWVTIKLMFFLVKKEVFGRLSALFRYEQAKNTFQTDVDGVNELINIFPSFRHIVTFIWVNRHQLKTYKITFLSTCKKLYRLDQWDSPPHDASQVWHVTVYIHTVNIGNINNALNFTLDLFAKPYIIHTKAKFKICDTWKLFLQFMYIYPILWHNPEWLIHCSYR